MREFELNIERNNHKAFTNFLWALDKTDLIKPDTALGHLLYCFTNEDLHRGITIDDTAYELQNVLIADDYYDILTLWFATLNKDVVKCYCTELLILITMKYGNDAIDDYADKLNVDNICGAINDLKRAMQLI